MDPRKMLRLPPLAAGAVALLLIAGGTSCKFTSPSYTLTVIVPDTITGSPASGQYTYKELTAVSFSYTAVDPLYSVEVYLNGKLRYSSSGSIYLYGDGYTLKPDIIDDRGNWTITMTDTSATVATYIFTVTLSGSDVLSGTFTDSRGYHGTWTGSSGTLLLTYTDWYDFVLTGTVYGLGAGTAGSYVGNSTTGTWVAKKAS
ncbi:MAG TPA: hypothetical protein VEG35_01000 [Burkholderiales bacterium]|nr:hypothetical protein [Burkholderiales bacterium]